MKPNNKDETAAEFIVRKMKEEKACFKRDIVGDYVNDYLQNLTMWEIYEKAMEYERYVGEDKENADDLQITTYLKDIAYYGIRNRVVSLLEKQGLLEKDNGFA
jgi:hypothetical protein